jgi:hypothetical protein
VSSKPTGQSSPKPAGQEPAAPKDHIAAAHAFAASMEAAPALPQRTGGSFADWRTALKIVWPTVRGMLDRLIDSL